MQSDSVSTLASPYNHKALSLLRNRRFNEDPIHEGPAVNGEKAVWYKVDKAAAAVHGGVDRIMGLVSSCFRIEGLSPDARVLGGVEHDKEHTMEFAFPAGQQQAVMAAVTRINAASRKLQQGMQVSGQSL